MEASFSFDSFDGDYVYPVICLGCDESLILTDDDVVVYCTCGLKYVRS